jgi:hypothetical protein
MKIISEIVKVFDIEPFQIGEGDAFRFRLEVSRELNAETYVAKVYRLEMYRLQPTFPQASGAPSDLKNDALIYVVDDVFDSNELIGASVEQVIAKFEKAFNVLFTTK